MSKRDKQRSRCYKWERENIHNHDFSTVRISEAQKLVDYIWKNEGLSYPPIVKRLDPSNTARSGCANRRHVRLLETVGTATLIHELAHSMTITIDGNIPDGGAHGPIFVGVYMKLLTEYMKIPLSFLTKTADKAGVRYDLNAKPVMKGT